MATTTKRSSTKTDGRAKTAARDLVRAVSDATEDLDGRLSSAAETAGEGVRGTSAALRQRSDATLVLLATFSLGMTTGLLVGGAHRLLTAASLLPAALIGGVILERVDGGRRRQG